MMGFGDTWRTLGLWTRKVVECCKQGFVGHTSRSLGDSSAESNMDYGGPAQEVSD